MGSLREHKTRADFSRGFFAVAGYETICPPGFRSPQEAAEGFAQSNARIAVICSTDENYPALVPPLVKALRSKRTDALIVLAGYPQEQLETHRQAGVDEFVHIRTDALEFLANLHSKLGIQ
jgi:methylmalonyl-CoA mutase